MWVSLNGLQAGLVRQVEIADYFLIGMQLSNMLFQVEISTEPFRAVLTNIGFLVGMGVHMECEVVDLVECFRANGAFELLFDVVGQFVVLVVTLLVEPFATDFTLVRFVTLVDSHVGVQRGTAIERFATGLTDMRSFRGVDDLVSTESARLTKSFPTNLKKKNHKKDNTEKLIIELIVLMNWLLRMNGLRNGR